MNRHSERCHRNRTISGLVKKKTFSNLSAWVLLSATLAATHFASAYPEPAPAAPFDGYTLIAPMRSNITYLIDLQGQCVHSWKSDYPPGLGAYLLENGHLLRTARLTNQEDDAVFKGAMAGGRIQEFSWDGELLWDFEYASDRYRRHHDVAPMPNGNVLLIAWERKTADEAIAAGRDPHHIEAGELWPDHIVEIEPQRPTGGRIVWEWHVWDHLVQDFDPTKANYGVVGEHPELVDINWVNTQGEPQPDKLAEEQEKLAALGYMPSQPPETPREEKRERSGHFRAADFNHTNSVAYNPDLDQIALSVLKFSEIWIIDHGTTKEEAAGHTGGRQGKGGDLLYRWGNPQTYRMGTPEDQRFFGQHDARWIVPGRPGAGHLLAFNNGRGRPGEPYSTIEEIVPPLLPSEHYDRASGAPFGPADATWRYTAPEKTSFFSPAISGADRQPNGNTLICEGVKGRLFEVTPAGETVWEYLRPEITGPGMGIFKTRRYAPDFSGLAGRALLLEEIPPSEPFFDPPMPPEPPEMFAAEMEQTSDTTQADVKSDCPIIYVNQNATGTGDGLSWVNACTTITQGITAARTRKKQIWIAQGTYYESFRIPAGLTLYGGFSGMETALEQRDWNNYVTIIDGEKKHQCVYADDTTSAVNGITLQNGVAYEGDGGGMYQGMAINCIFRNNIAVEEWYYYYYERWSVGGAGGGKYNGTAINCIFYENSAEDGGGMCDGTAINCVFYNNTAPSGGGMSNRFGSLSLTNCTLFENAALYGGGIWCNSGSSKLTNCIFWENTGGEICGSSKPMVTYSCVGGGYEGEGNTGGNPLFWDTVNGDFRLHLVSPCVNSGTSADAPECDIRGIVRTQGAEVDMGAYEMDAIGGEADSDGDGLADAFEIAHSGTDPSNPDSDGDGVSDGDDWLSYRICYVNAAVSAVEQDGKSWEMAFSSIQAAVDTTYIRGGGEVWVASGTYTGTDNNVVTLRYNVALYGGFNGTEGARDARDWATNESIIDGESARRCVFGANNAVLDGFTIQNGYADKGGGMYDRDYTSPSVTNCTFSGNSAKDDGGGMYNHNYSSPSLTNCTFSENSADCGGGMSNYNHSSPSVTNCTFSENSTISKGGGMCNCYFSSPAVSNCTLLENSTNSDGGGMYNDYFSSPPVSNCTFSKNSAYSDGGGMYNYGSFPPVSNCTFLENSTNSDGGGMYSYHSSPSVSNCTFLKNSANSYGGGMCIEYLSPALINCTFSGNSAISGGGLYNGNGYHDFPKLTNCILWNDSGGEIYNCEFCNSEIYVTYSCIEGDYYGVGNINADPLFADSDNGEFALLAGSPCYNTGTAEGAPTFDIRGVPRPQGNGVDMGAYEMRMVVVPEVTGLDRQAAHAMILAAGLNIGDETDEFTFDITNGYVVRQNPLAETLAQEFTQVALVIA